MARIFLTHVPDMLRNYYGERAVAALRKLGEVRINDSGRVLDADALAAAARGCAPNQSTGFRMTSVNLRA
jgi:D-3-phosphoglycerate dehydrogenase